MSGVLRGANRPKGVGLCRGLAQKKGGHKFLEALSYLLYGLCGLSLFFACLSLAKAVWRPLEGGKGSIDVRLFIKAKFQVRICKTLDRPFAYFNRRA